MIKSMTGFGQAETDSEKFTCKVEIKSLNNKFFELNLRMPRQWQNKELELRRDIGKLIERGTATLSINLTYKRAEDKTLPLNLDVAEYYINELKLVANNTGLTLSDLYNSVFEFPNITSPKEDANTEEDWQQIISTAKKAYQSFDEFRTNEGAMLEAELLKLCNSIMEKADALEEFEAVRIENIKTKLRKELDVFANEMADKNRFEQELIYYIEKLDISEEKSRLKQHCDYFIQTVNENSTGKKLGFIAQEMGREINTIGSKSNEPNMQRKVVEMKDELEKIKEQINNVL